MDYTLPSAIVPLTADRWLVTGVSGVRVPQTAPPAHHHTSPPAHHHTSPPAHQRTSPLTHQPTSQPNTITHLPNSPQSISSLTH
ncbi:hypothetical protein E2C01_026243 [Portunus trituberculatus]|uniref:Uncharacterized protein n=1 Tax=Portunus trituberculatus TaxID=210409 RepID=A0A5B7EI40_PORTR|nr:hypothetical protein [Portunus trituberculatus]